MTNEIFIDGDQDVVQLRVQGHTAQSEPLQTWEDSAAQVLAQVTADGRLQLGDLSIDAPDALIEANQAISLPSSTPSRGVQSRGLISRLGAAIADAIAWTVHELELLGDSGVSGVHTALRSKNTLKNTGDADQAELRAGDFEAINEGANGTHRLGRLTGLHSAVTNEVDGHVDEAVGVGVAIQDEGTDPIQTAYGLLVEDMPASASEVYAIHTGSGPVHLGDYLEMVKPASVPAQPQQDNVRLYPKADGKLYAKNWQGTEYDLTTGIGGIDVSEDGASVLTGASEIDFRDADVVVNGSVARVYLALPSVCDGRLTLDANNAVTTSDVTAATQVYFAPYHGNRVALLTADAWKVCPFTTASIKLTDVQSGTRTSGSPIITNLSDTSQFIVGMAVTGTGIASETTIASINSATQVTLNKNATASGTSSLTFKVAANKNLDLFAYWTGSAVKLEMVAWTSDTARATALTQADGVYAKSGDTSRRYLGTVRTTATAGQTEDSVGKRLVYNEAHPVVRKLKVVESTFAWSYSTNAWRAANNSTANRVQLVVGNAGPLVALDLMVRMGGSGSGGVQGIAYDAVNAYHMDVYPNLPSDGHISSHMRHAPAVGYHYYQWVENARGNSCTMYGFADGAYLSGMVGEVTL